MKIISLILLIMLAGNCDEQKRDMETAVVEYSASTRGFYQKTTVRNKVVQVSRDRDGVQAPEISTISDADWNSLVQAFSKVELEQLPSLEAPSEKRAFDGAAIGTLRIRYQDKMYVSSAFDHGNPPEEIREIVEIMVKLGKKDDGN